MKALYLVILMLVIGSCSQNIARQSFFFKYCTCDKVDFHSGLDVTDSTGRITMNVPVLNWKPLKFIENDRSTITQGNTIGQGYSVITTSVYEFDPPWN